VILSSTTIETVTFAELVVRRIQTIHPHASAKITALKFHKQRNIVEMNQTLLPTNNMGTAKIISCQQRHTKLTG